MTLPNLTPGLKTKTREATIPTNSFEVSISCNGKRFPAIAANVVSWEHIVDEEYDDEYDDEEDEDGTEIISVYHTLALSHKVTVDVLDEINELLPSKDYPTPLVVTVTITYRTPATVMGEPGTPVFRHSFTGEPRGAAKLKATVDDGSPLLFTLLIDCEQVSLTQRI